MSLLPFHLLRLVHLSFNYVIPVRSILVHVCVLSVCDMFDHLSLHIVRASHRLSFHPNIMVSWIIDRFYKTKHLFVTVNDLDEWEMSELAANYHVVKIEKLLSACP